MQEAYQLDSTDRVLQKTPCSFDVSVWEFFWPLLYGAQLVVALPEGHRDSAYLVKLIVEQQITTLHFVPSMLGAFLEERNVETCRSLRRVICSGETLPFEFQRRFFDRLGADLHNLYGPTEAAVDVTYWVCKREGPLQMVPIGRPIANIQIYLLDAQLNPVPIGVQGELYIGGIGVGRGYLNRPELTAERFIPNVFTMEPKARLYKTGDLARYLPDGNIEFLGRIDHQVKIRGFRIELGEVEAVLDLHPAVRESIVIAHEDMTGDKRLVAYVALQRGQTATVADLRSHVTKQLPMYMVPSAFVLLDSLPVTPNGKVNRRALHSPEFGKHTVEGLEELYVAPVLTVHHQLVHIWEELLNVRPIGIRDNFFDLGGHSLLAARMVARIEQVCGKKLSFSTLFAEQTIEHLANALQERDDTHTQVLAPLVTVQASGSKRPFFFLHGDWTGSAFYCLKLARYLGPDQPFYALEPYRFDSQFVPPTFEEMTAAHFRVAARCSARRSLPAGGLLQWGVGGL